MKRTFSLLIPLIFLMSFSSYAQTANELITQSRLNFEKKQYSAALIHLKNAAKNEPKNLQVRLELIKLFVFTGQGVQAQTELNKAIRLKATSSQITILQAKTQLLQGEFDKVSKNFNFTDLPQSDIARVRALQGQAHYQKREFDKARLLFQRAFLLAPNELEVQIAQARLYKIDGNQEQEKKLVESLFQRYPNRPEVMLLAAEYYRSTQQYDLALKLYKQAGEIQSTNVNVWFGIVRTHIAKAEYNAAKLEIQKVLLNHPEHQVGNYLLSVIAFEQGDYARAKSAIDIVIQGKKRDNEAYKLLATIQFQQKEYSLAESNVKKFIKHNPNDLQAQKLLASVYLKRQQNTLAIDRLIPLQKYNDTYVFSMLANAYQRIGNTEKSQFYITKALSIEPNNKTIKRQYQLSRLQSGQAIAIIFSDPEYKDFLGKGHLPILSLFAAKRYDQASDIIKGYLKNTPDNALLHYLYASSEQYQNNLTLAKKEFLQSIKLNPRFTEAKISLAKIFIREGDDRKAERLFREVLKLSPNNDQSFISLAGIFNRKGDKDKMMTWLNKSRLNNKASLASREVLIDIYKQAGNMTKVLDISQEMVDIQPESIRILVKHAENLKLSGRPDLAVQVHKKITQLKPKSSVAWYGLAKMQSFDKDYTESYKSFEKLLTLAPNSLIARVVLTQYDLQNNQKDKALIRAQELIEIHPKLADSYDTLANVYIAIDKPKEAIQQYKKALAINPNSTTYIKLFSAYNRNKQIEKAYQELQKWVKQNPNDFKLKEVLGITYQRRSEFKKAQKLFQEIIKKDPENDHIFNNLALVSLQLKMPMSMEYADIAYNINSKNPSNLDTLGWIHLQNNNTNEAIKYLSQAVEKAPENPDFRYHLAVALAQADRTREAKNQLALIVQIEGRFLNRKNAIALFKTL